MCMTVFIDLTACFKLKGLEVLYCKPKGTCKGCTHSSASLRHPLANPFIVSKGALGNVLISQAQAVLLSTTFQPSLPVRLLVSFKGIFIAAVLEGINSLAGFGTLCCSSSCSSSSSLYGSSLCLGTISEGSSPSCTAAGHAHTCACKPQQGFDFGVQWSAACRERC